jgi:hypothetical protein
MDKSPTIDAVDILLRDKPHPGAKDLLAFYEANPEFLSRIVGEFRLLKRLGRKVGGAKALIHFLRWEGNWRSVDDFEINDHLGPLAIRVCALLWSDIDGMMRFYSSAADDILGTWIRRGKKHGDFLCPGKHTLSAASFLPPERSGAGLVRPIRRDGFITLSYPPDVPELDRPATFHGLISEAKAASVVEPLRRIAESSPNPQHPRIRAWIRHFEFQPEIFAFMEKTLLERRPECFSANSLVEYARWAVRRAAECHKRFSLPNDYSGLYSRALINRNPKFNGRCELRDRTKSGGCNQFLGCFLAPEPINGEPYRRLIWNEVTR